MKRHLNKLLTATAKCLLTFLLLLSFTVSRAQTQLVEWTFANFTNTPTASLPQNNGKLVTAVGQTQSAFVSAVGTTYDPPCIVNGWNVPANTAYFLINFSTVDYQNITITYFLGAFQFGVKSFQPQYSVFSNAGPWLDFGTAVTFQPSGGDQLFVDVPLPPDADNQPNVWVRLLSTTTTVNTGGDYIDEIEVNGNAMVPLAAGISEFGVKAEPGYNVLYWTTVNEKNNSHFAIEHAANARDFVTIAETRSQAETGNSNFPLHYQFTDHHADVGHHFYRLKQFDQDGRFTYSKVMDIFNTATGEVIQVYPNPTQDIMHLDYYADHENAILLQFADMQGRIVKEMALDAKTGNNRWQIDLGGLPADLYLLKINQHNETLYSNKIRKW